MLHPLLCFNHCSFTSQAAIDRQKSIEAAAEESVPEDSGDEVALQLDATDEVF